MQGNNPVDLFKDEINSDQLHIKVNAIHRVTIIAALIGPEKVKRQIIPKLEELIQDDEDEVLFAVAQVAGNLYPDYCKSIEKILKILEELAHFEETVVRDAASKSIISLCLRLPSDQITGVLVPSVLRLANWDWFPGRVSAIQILTEIYDKSGVHKDTLRKKFQDISQEHTPMIKRAIATSIGVLSKKMKPELFLAEMMPIFKDYSEDDHDVIRVLCINSLIQISKNLSKEMNKNNMIPILIKMTTDRAWRVRKTLCMNFKNISNALGKETSDTSLINIFSTLLQDPEGEVRIEAVAAFVDFVRLVSPSKLTTVTQQIPNLLSDTLCLVRVGAAEIMTFLASLVPIDSLKKKYLPKLIQVLNQEEDNEVKIAMVNAIKACGIALGKDFFNLFSQSEIGKIFSELNWRVRKAGLSMIIDLAVSVGSIELFEVHLQEFFFKYFEDGVFAIRKFGNKELKKILDLESSQWILSTFVPKMTNYLNSGQNYLIKMTALYAFEVIITNFNGNIKTKSLSQLLTGAKDKVGNVRMVTANICGAIYSSLDEGEKGSVKNCISGLVGDPDKDVRYSAKMFMNQHNH